MPLILQMRKINTGVYMTPQSHRAGFRLQRWVLEHAPKKDTLHSGRNPSKCLQCVINALFFRKRGLERAVTTHVCAGEVCMCNRSHMWVHSRYMQRPEEDASTPGIFLY